MKSTYAKSQQRINRFCSLIIKNKLMFQRGGISIALRNREKINIVGLVYHKKRAVGCCVITNENIMFGYNIAVYVLPQYRKFGFGKRIMNYTKLNSDINRFICCRNGSAARNLYKET